jgi:hypothetical protein
VKRGSTLFLRAAVFLIGAIVLALCIFVLPVGLSTDTTEAYRPILDSMYIAAVPFYIALYQAIRLLDYIDKNNAFSDQSVKAIKNIKYCAALIAAFYGTGLPYIYYVAEMDDAPGVMMLGLVIVFGSAVVATFAAVLQKLVQNGVDIKSENDLTV